MKKLIFLLLVLSSVIAKSQGTIYFQDDNIYWYKSGDKVFVMPTIVGSEYKIVYQLTGSPVQTIIINAATPIYDYSFAQGKEIYFEYFRRNKPNPRIFQNEWRSFGQFQFFINQK
jgi:hypothetical protein